jgi:hypothetical protein
VGGLETWCLEILIFKEVKYLNKVLNEMRKLIYIVEQLSYTAPLEQTLDDIKVMANAVKDMSNRIDVRVRKSLQPTDKTNKKSAKKGKAIAKAKPFPSIKPPQVNTASSIQQTTPNSAVGI